MTTDEVATAISLIRAGQKTQARQLLERALRSDPRDSRAWLWMSEVVEDDPKRRKCLERVLELDPGNSIAQKGLLLLSRREARKDNSASSAPPHAPVISVDTETTPSPPLPLHASAPSPSADLDRRLSSLEARQSAYIPLILVIAVIWLVLMCSATSLMGVSDAVLIPGSIALLAAVAAVEFKRSQDRAELRKYGRLPIAEPSSAPYPSPALPLLTRCKICDREVSRSAPSCPHCGVPSPGLRLICPRCGSMYIAWGQKGFSLAKAAAGGLLLGPVGLLGGLAGRKDIQLGCLACNFRWQPRPGELA